MSYAIIKTGGKQYRVAEGDVIEVEKLDVEAGSETTFAEVLFISNGGSFKHAAADLKGSSVIAEVIGAKKAPKVICYKYRRRKGYHRTVGHRRQLTQLRIKSITL
jgi:large subunit ribosomal protein L21